MALSHSLVSQFAKVMSQEPKTEPAEVTVTGTARQYAGDIYVQLDGSDQLTPIASSTVGMKDGDRVTVQIKNHSASVTGNATDPAASSQTVGDMQTDINVINNKIGEFDTVVANMVTTDELEAQTARIDTLVADNVTIKEQLTATSASIDNLEAENATITEKLTAAEADITQLHADMLTVDVANATYATIENLEATNADIRNLEADYGDFKQLATDNFTAYDAKIDELETGKLDAAQADIKYANIDFANIGDAAIENFFSKSGIIGDLVVDDGHVTGTLVGVTIKGDLIEGGTVVADKLVILGDDGLYYKLNTNGETVTSEQTEYNSLNGSVITAKSVTAEKINVSDLVAFGATIGGFKITENSLYSGVKESIDNTTNGVYMGSDGQFSLGNENNYLKFFKDSDEQWKLEISADALKFSSGGSLQQTITEIQDNAKSALESSQTNAKDITSLANTVKENVSDLQGQIDGSISTWFYAAVPTLSNAPANGWTTDDIKNNHLGDLYYDTTTDYAYRFMLQNGVYSWDRIQDSDAVKALADAAAAQDAADSKRRVFVSQPTPPYDVGDLWVQGSSGDILRCATAKTAFQSYGSADWVLASKYTDDSSLEDYKKVVTNTYSTKSEVTQTQEKILQTVSSTYSTKTELGDAIAKEVTDRNSAIEQSADSITQTVSETYTTKDAMANYASKTEVTQTVNEILSEVETNYQSKDGMSSYATKTDITQSENSILSEVESTYQSKDDMASYASKSYVDQKDNSITATVSEISETASSALTKATTVEQTAEGLEVRLTQAEKDVDTAQSTANTANSTANSAQTTANSANTAAKNAQSTASTANSTANTALSTANSANTAASNAAKTATNYLGFSSSGLVVGTNSSGTGQSGLQGNVRLYNGGMEVRSGSTVLARYASNSVELGVNSSISRISMCGGNFGINVKDQTTILSNEKDTTPYITLGVQNFNVGEGRYEPRIDMNGGGATGYMSITSSGGLGFNGGDLGTWATDTGWRFVYSNNGEYVKYRRLGKIVVAQWNFSQESTTYWGLQGVVAADCRPSNSAYLPAALVTRDGYLLNNTAYGYINVSGDFGFQAGAAISGAHNVGIATWLIG